MKTQIIIHGHFYQPPRENPETGIIQQQMDNSEFLDWNENITESCYKTNAYSRFLNQFGNIKNISNNYSWISWNFGPTLLEWLKKNHPDIISKLQLSDKESIKRLGYGNAVAQGFNHTILPLDSPRTRELEVKWGIDYFKSIFNRQAEGFWCPECAINSDTIDTLAENNIKWVILSPWQVKTIENENSEMVELGSSPAPFDQPYIIQGKKHSITAFFYNPDLASGISFGHYLKDADKLYDKLLEIKNKNNCSLIHYATDGEIYGHHEPFGDMAIAALIQKIKTKDDFELVNYSSYLEKHPAVLHAILKSGEDNKGTSWSCEHGVSRWYKDCSCQTGGQPGWNQKWRTPLRSALASLESVVYSTFDKEIKNIFENEDKKLPFNLLVSYSQVLSQTQTVKAFVNAQNIKEDNKVKLALLFEGVKNMMYSFTSCGFFFSEISGLESKQNLCYALYAIKILSPFLPKGTLDLFMDTLSQAKSNIKKEGNGKTIVQKLLKTLSGEVEAGLYFYISNKITKTNIDKGYGYYKLISSDSQKYFSLFNTNTLQTYNLIINGNIDENRKWNFTVQNEKNEEQFFDFQDIPKRMVHDFILQINSSGIYYRQSELLELSRLMHIYSSLLGNKEDLKKDSYYQENCNYCVYNMRSVFNVSNSTFIKNWEKNKSSIKTIISFLKNKGRNQDILTVKTFIDCHISKIAHQTLLTPQDIDFLYDFIRTIREINIEPNLTEIQNKIYPLLKQTQKVEGVLFELGKDLNFDMDFLN
ncbi:MAG: DUF3536 domain-containing protein [Sphaerochaetaceae bacterium]